MDATLHGGVLLSLLMAGCEVWSS